MAPPRLSRTSGEVVLLFPAALLLVQLHAFLGHLVVEVGREQVVARSVHPAQFIFDSLEGRWRKRDVREVGHEMVTQPISVPLESNQRLRH